MGEHVQQTFQNNWFKGQNVCVTVNCCTGDQADWIWTLGLLLVSCVTLGELPNLSVPHVSSSVKWG